MKALLSLSEQGHMVALLETGKRIVARDSREMVEQLRLAGVSADELTVTDWKIDYDHAPLSGQIVAIKAALRRS